MKSKQYYFESINLNPMIVMISDDTMLPMYEIGDYVDGILGSGIWARQYIATQCIITKYEQYQ